MWASEETSGKDADCSIEELVAAQLTNAERTLAMQHQCAVRALRQRLEASSTQHFDRLKQENEALRARLAMLAGSGDAAAGEGATIVNKVSNDADQALRNSATSEGMIVWSVADSEEGLPVRPDSRERKAIPDPPSHAPFRLPGEMHDKHGAEDDSDDELIKSMNYARKTKMPESIERKNQIDLQQEKAMFKLLEVWASRHMHKGIEHSVYSMQLSEMKALRGKDATGNPEREDTLGGDYVDTFHQTGRLAAIVVHPYNTKRSIWDVTSLFLVLWDMIMIPMGFFDLPDSLFLDVMEWITRVFWTLDMPLSFVSGFVTVDGTIELRLKQIIRRYLKGWFLLDSLVVGVDWLEIVMSAAAESLGFARLGKASRVFRILRMIRLLRLARMTEVVTLLTERLNSEKLVIVIDILKLMIIMCSAGHLLACLWYAIGEQSHGNEGRDSWLVEYEFVDSSLDMRYVMSLRWAISQFAGGMDEVTPQSFGEHAYAVCVYLTAFWSGAVFLSILTSSMTQWYIIGSQTSQQLTVLRRYLSQNGISKKLALRVQRNAQHAMAEQQRAMPEAAVGLITKVSEPLKIELHFEMYSPNLSVHPFFNRYIEECPHVMRKVCHSAMNSITVSIGDTIFNGGEIPAEPRMYIVSRGLLSYTSALDGAYTCVHPGDWVSEPTLWVQWVHRGTLCAIEDCLLFVLLASEFQTIVGHFEHIGFDPRGYAHLFVDALNEKDHEVNDLQIPELSAKLRRANSRRKSFFHYTGDHARRGGLQHSSSKTGLGKDEQDNNRHSQTSQMSRGSWADSDWYPSEDYVDDNARYRDSATSLEAVQAYARGDHDDCESEDSLVITRDHSSFSAERDSLASITSSKRGKSVTSNGSSRQAWRAGRPKHGVSFSEHRQARMPKHDARSELVNQQNWCDEQEV